MKSNLWKTAILLVFCLLVVLCEHSNAPNFQEKVLSIQRVAPHSQVSITCPNITGDQLRFHLMGSASWVMPAGYRLLGSTCNSAFKIHTTEGTKQLNQNHNGTRLRETFVQFFPAEPNQNLSNRFVFTVNRTGLYCCEVERLWPPPYKQDNISTLLIEEEECQRVPDDPPGCPDPGALFLWLSLVGCGVLLFYSFGVTIGIIIVMRKQKETSKNDVYMNVTPAERKGQKRSQDMVIRKF
ncbi:hypothetical protein DPEC_G00135590 [Dallia pectoralis]|uniref:Uncharacterized protein n=1 Tax=Dallia pectoralis TaxID=75939 RepID=A0ACC2GL90_DALPE|nr:hypothetical protein DPEC_G00135590 [Dallia pectoralis]